MRILITNLEMASATGTVAVVRDLALGLRARGHVPVIYSHTIAVPGRDLQRQGIEIVDDIDAIRERPDAIHGHHNVATVMALARFPGCPCVYWSHGRFEWFDVVPRFERIRRNLTVDVSGRRFVATSIRRPEWEVEILHNGVDLKRIGQRPVELPERPQRALAFTRWAESVELPVLREASLRNELKFRAIGNGVRRPTLEPEQWLVRADIVFGRGRSALEAMCSGAAVIVVDPRGLAGMVTSSNFAAMRRVNFGGDAMIHRLTVDSIEREIARYDARDATRVSEMAREDADFEKVLDRLERAYAAVIAEQAATGWTDDDCRSLDAFLASHWHEAARRHSPWCDWDALGAKLAAMGDHNRCHSS